MSDETKARYAEADPKLAVGTHHEGFTVTQVEPLPELEGYAYVMRHDASGARMMWLAVDDDNKSFSISFKTPPADDTGVFHILEHSVLCGSDRFPVKEPFVNLLKTSMKTFLNAMTFPDKTMYPVASTNVADLENLMDVYLDAVLHPAIYQRPRIFEQEGWHLEVDDEGKALSYNGVVYNEMKGALSDPGDVLALELGRALFPDSPYRFESGGDPRSIPTLTYEQFIDAHARHYTLANSYTILYGNLDIDRELAFVGERFDGATDRGAGAPNELPLQAPVTPAPVRVEMDCAREDATVGLGYVCGTAAERERMCALDVLVDTLTGSNEAPLKRAVLDAGLGDDFTATILEHGLQIELVFRLRGAKEGVAERFAGLVEGECARMVAEGIERERLEASLASLEFGLRELDPGSTGNGVYLSMRSLSSWLYDDERPVDYLRFEESMDHMRAGLDGGYFEDLLRDVICESDHHVTVEIVPVEDGAAAEEEARLASLRATMSDEDVEGVRREVAALREMQEAPDSPEDLATLPCLTIDDIGEADEERPLEQVDAPLPCLYHDLSTRRIGYASYYFDLGHLSFEDLPYASLLVELLGGLSTARHSAADLDTLIELELGTLAFRLDTYVRDYDTEFCRPVLSVRASALSERLASLATIPAEIWGETDFSDTERMRALLTQRRIGLSRYFAMMGHAAAIARLNSQYCNSGKVTNATSGIDFYLFLRDLLDHWDERKDDLAARLERLCKEVFTADNVTVSFAGSREDLQRFWEQAGRLSLADSPAARGHNLRVPKAEPVDEAFVVSSNVSFVAEGMAMSELDRETLGTWQVASQILSYGYLWNEVRVKGGAYGTGFRRSNLGLPQFYSFRDPNVDETLARYEAAGEWLRTWDGDQDELDGFIITVVAAHDAPATAKAIARRQDAEFLAGKPANWRDELRKQDLACTIEKIRSLADALSELRERRSVVVIGPREAIEGSSIDFQVTNLVDEA